MGVTIFNNKRLFHPDTVRYITQLANGRPDYIQQRRIDNLVIGIKSCGCWGMLDRLWILANTVQEMSRVSLVNPTSTQLTEVNSPTWTNSQGYTGDAATMSINTNYNVSTGVNYTRNNSFHGVYIMINQQSLLNNSGWAKSGGGDSRATIIPRGSGGSADLTLLTINENNVNGINVASTDGRGFWTVERTGANATEGFKNGVSVGTGALASVALPSITDMILCRNLNGAANGWDNNQVAMRCQGAAMGAARQMNFYLCIERYMDSLGTGVV